MEPPRGLEALQVVRLWTGHPDGINQNIPSPDTAGSTPRLALLI
jgi:hypothetical protein